MKDNTIAEIFRLLDWPEHLKVRRKPIFPREVERNVYRQEEGALAVKFYAKRKIKPEEKHILRKLHLWEDHETWWIGISEEKKDNRA